MDSPARGLTKEDKVNENAKHHDRGDELREEFRIKWPGVCGRGEGGRTMTAMVPENGKNVAASGAGFQRHAPLIAESHQIARHTRALDSREPFRFTR